MKFTYGYWVNKPGVSIADAVQIRQIKVKEDRVYLYAVPYAEDYRAMGGPVLEMFVSAPRRNIIRLQAYHFMGSNQKEPKFDLNFEQGVLQTKEFEGGIEIISGDTRLVITKNPCSFTYYYKDKVLTQIGNRYGHAMISTIKTPEGPFMRAQLDVAIGEKVYGLGERFTPFVKNGQVVDIWNEDGGTATEIAYKNIPFYITNRGYGVFVNSSDCVSYEVCSEAVTRVQFSVPGECIDFMVIGGEDMKDVLHGYTDLTGKPALPPPWSFGLWLTTSFTTSYDEDTVMSFVNGMAERKIPLSVFHFDCYWMKENEWCSFEWDPDMFQDVDGMLARMKHDKKLKICVWINSYIGQKSPLFLEAKEKGYLLKRPNGDVWQWDMWQAGMGLVDFTNPDAYRWYQDKLRRLLDQGVDCFKTDFGERIPTDVVYFDGSDPIKMHNYYTYLYNKCVFELLEEYKGKRQACVFARSATVGGQKFPVHWGGDCNSNYPSMNESLRSGLSLCMSGFGFWSHDMSGFEGTATPDVYKRWAAFGLLSTHSRLHGSSSYRVPWLFDEESVDVVRHFSQFKCRLMPYLFTEAVKTHQTGIPTMRAMVMEFTADHSCDDLDRQYMLGDYLMVSPIFSEDGTADYYLPKGKWTHLFDNREIEGGQWMVEQYDYFSLPLFVRENAILALGANDQTPEYDYGKDLELHLFALSDRAATSVCDMDGKQILTAEAVHANGKVTVRIDGRIDGLKLVLRNVPAVKALSGAIQQNSTLGAVLTVTEPMITFEL